MTSFIKTYNDILCINFNQDQSCFVSGTTTGFGVYNTDPFKQMMIRKLDGGIGYIEMLDKTNFFALIGGGKKPAYPSNKVIIWDDRVEKNIVELSFRSVAKSVKLTNNRIVVALDHKMYIYNFTDLKLLEQIPTSHNPNGLSAISKKPDLIILARLSVDLGTIDIDSFGDKKTITNIDAHTNDISVIALNFDGTMVATASKKGTIIRVFDTLKGTKLFEFRRGMDSANILNICFDRKSKLLAVASTKGTIHIYSLHLTLETKIINTISSLSLIKNILPVYFSSEWSYKQIKIPNIAGHKLILTFGTKDNTLIIISASGVYYLVTFDGDIPKYTTSSFI
jgi:WD40 repeat protein